MLRLAQLVRHLTVDSLSHWLNELSAEPKNSGEDVAQEPW